jgi:hypothetical protein
MQPQVVARIFTDFIMEARLLERIGEPATAPEVADLDFTLRQLLAAIPLQYWPYPTGGACPCAFCEAEGDPDQLETHLHESHQEILAGGKFYSAVQLQVAGLTGIDIFVDKRSLWKCPFHGCLQEFESYSNVVKHVTSEHYETDVELFRRLGGFWAAIISYVNSTGTWPTVGHILSGGNQDGRVATRPLDPMSAGRIWTSGAIRVDRRTVIYRRLEPESPFTGLLDLLTSYSNGTTSEASSEVEEVMRGR